MATNNLLNQPTPHYHKFVDNQVLTDDQLNAVLDYLNHQDRFSRLLLQGVGIVCGLKISLDETNEEINLTDGVAVTTAGDLIKPGAKKYIGFKAFKDANVKYPFFTEDEGSTIDLWELETDTSPSDVRPIGEFESVTDIDLKQAIAVLYLEDYLGEEEDCSPVSCDTQGRPVINQVRVLLVSPEHAKKIAEQDSIFSNLLQGGNNPFVQNLSKVYVPRVMLKKANTGSFDEFRKAYKISFANLADKISELGSVTIFENTFNEAGVDPTSELHNVEASALNFQYVYDFYKDLADAYNDLRELLKRNYALCCPDPAAFPKHVLLGNLMIMDKKWRHPFYPSPTHMHDAVGNMIKAFKRLLQMIKSFQPSAKNQIRVTPSRDDDFVLGKRAVPFYYNLEKEEDVSVFLQNWKEEEVELVPNYYGANYPGGGFNPLEVRLDDHDFYRIEGHTGKHITDAHKQIKKIQEEKSLPFDIQQVAIGGFPDESTIDYDKYRVYFEDLQVILQAWNEEQQCLVKTASDFLTKFSTKDPGTHIAYLPPMQEVVNNNFIAIDNSMMRESVAYKYGTTKSGEPDKTRENQVIKNISTEENTLGYVMKDAVEVTDNKNDFWVKTNHAVMDMVANWNVDIKTATIDIPAQLLGYLKETEDYKLTDIEDFTEENLKKYLDSLRAQCRKTAESKKKLQSLLNKDDSVLRSKDWVENYQYVLNRISSSCCIIEKVKVLYEKIIERKKQLLNKFVLEQFVKDHPGAEHKAGVEKGGTFVLLYYSKSRQEKSADVAGLKNLAMVMDVEATGQPASEEVFRRGFTEMSEFSGGMEVVREMAGAAGEEVINIPGVRDIIRTAARENIPQGTVIGDLCLPYVCCSGTPSTSFVFPEQLATLRIPTDHLCVDENNNADPIPLSVTPAEGTVKAFIQKRELENVIRVEETGVFFDPNKIAAEDYGNSIRFEVNGQPVEPILEINRKPVPKFTFSDEISFRKENSIAVVTFQNRSEPFNELTFEWVFDGEKVENENALEFTRSFKVKPGQNFDFEVKLTAFSGACKETFVDHVNIDVPELDIEDDPEEPEQPEENCTDISTRAIKASFNVITKEANELGRSLDRQVQSFYSRSIKSVYQLILEDPESALNGKFDDRIMSFIQETQKLVVGLIQNQRSEAQQEFLLKLYYEAALLYFYIQACRDTVIKDDIAFQDRQLNWLTFTEMVVKEYGQALKMLLEEDKIQSKFVVVQKRMGSRFDPGLTKLIQKIIKLLKG